MSGRHHGSTLSADSGTKPVATISIDVDPVDLHLIGYGFPGLPADPLVYTHALPRLAEVFARCGVRATFFVVGRDAASQAQVLGGLARAGHEIASHSFSHPMAFASLGPAGMRYDASAYPSPFLIPARLLLAFKSTDRRAVMSLKLWPFSLDRQPSVFRFGARSVREFPTSVTPALRFPIYHTLRYALGDARFGKALDGFAGRREPFSYVLHAVDALGQTEDRVDPRLAKHPGMNWALARKLELLEKTLGSIVERFAVATFEERVCAAEAAPAATTRERHG